MLDHKPLPIRNPDPDFESKHPVAAALRAAGYLPLPRLWVPANVIPEIHEIAERYRHNVNEIRANAKGQDYRTEPDPREDRDAAWAAFEKARNES